MVSLTPSQCQKHANLNAIWVLSSTRKNQFLAFLGVKNKKRHGLQSQTTAKLRVEGFESRAFFGPNVFL